MIKKFRTQAIIEENVYVEPCIICGCDNINISEYDDQYGYITTIRCSNEHESEYKGFKEMAAIKKWNKENNLDSVIRSKTELIISTKKEISELKKLKRLRAKIK